MNQAKGTKTIEDSRWVADKRGHKRLVVDEVDANTYCSRRREPSGWHRGARVVKRTTTVTGD